jgi:CheY-like chemotaxis protein
MQAMGTPMSLHAPIAQLPQAMGTPLPQAAPAAQGMAQAPLGVPTRRPTPMPGLATPLGPGSPPKRSTSSASMLRPITGGVPTPQAGVIAKPAPVAVIVEDDDEIRMLLRRVLTHDGLQVIEARAGDEGANILRQTRPDIVILDAMLPKLHGFEICAGIKRSEIFRGVPVVMISAVYKGFEQAREIQEVHGADAFVEKPFEVHFVRKLVAGLLHRKLERAAPPPDRAAQIEEARAAIDALYGASQWQQAAQHVDRWLGLDPFDARAWLERGNLLAQQGDLVRALGSYEYAAVYEPEMFAAHMNLSIVYEQLGFAKRAKETWARARDLAPDPMTRQKIEAHLGRAS